MRLSRRLISLGLLAIGCIMAVAFGWLVPAVVCLGLGILIEPVPWWDGSHRHDRTCRIEALCPRLPTAARLDSRGRGWWVFVSVDDYGADGSQSGRPKTSCPSISGGRGAARCSTADRARTMRTSIVTSEVPV